MNNYIKSIVVKYLIGKRCPKCFSSYSQDSFIISSQVGFTNKMRFFIKKPILGMPLLYDARLLTEDGPDREVLWVDKFRVNVPIISIEVHCKKCYHIRFVEIDHGHNIA